MISCSTSSNLRETVAKFLARHIDASNKSQLEIAAEVGFQRPNILSMIKKGVTNVPVSRVPALATALGLCEHDLLRRVLAENTPDLLAILDRLGTTPCSCSKDSRFQA